MKHFRRICLVGLTIYSCGLIGIELATSQSYVRHFFSDIETSAPFFAVNTTLSVSLLWGTALLFAVCMLCASESRGRNQFTLFFGSQLIIFAYLGFDDRFLVHERLGFRLGIGDHYILLAVAVIEILCLFGLGREFLKGVVGFNLLMATLLFGVMVFIDACLPHAMVLRLSLEDLAKTWATMFFFLFAWEILRTTIRRVAPNDEAAPG